MDSLNISLIQARSILIYNQLKVPSLSLGFDGQKAVLLNSQAKHT